jgi:hypothetical protein
MKSAFVYMSCQRVFVLIIAIVIFVCLSPVHDGFSQDKHVDAQSLQFLSSGQWYQYKFGEQRDDKENLFRLQSAAYDYKNDYILGVVNIMTFKCNDGYMDIHFPDNYKFRSVDVTTWLPNVTTYFRINNDQTFRVQSEISKNNIYVDFTRDNFNNIKNIVLAETIEIRFGPNAQSKSFISVNKDMADVELDVITNNISSASGNVEIIRVVGAAEMLKSCFG